MTPGLAPTSLIWSERQSTFQYILPKGLLALIAVVELTWFVFLGYGIVWVVTPS
jgi:hypothetical protein